MKTSYLRNMRVFKFGGASVKDAEGVRNVVSILGQFTGEKLVVIVSAMGKTTNALEKLNQAHLDQLPETFDIFSEIKQAHLNIIKDLFPDSKHPVYDEIENT
ncbi:MAG: aspartate kinase, partial [Bacteroidota bacterium]